MNRQSVFSIIFSCAFFTIKTFGQDASKIEKGYFLSVSAGLTNNSVYGTMVERNNQFGTDVKMEKKEGYTINVNIEKHLLNNLFLKTGLYFIHKQVNPMVNTFAVYQDELKTDYLSIPVELGMNLLPVKNALNFSLTIGTLTNLRVKDNSNIGPDRVAFKSPFLSESFCGGARVGFSTTSKNKFFLQYNYLYDITNSYIETLFWSTAEPNKDFIYKYKTHVITLGFLWLIK